jgi:class 3 adenylate cyclase
MERHDPATSRRTGPLLAVLVAVLVLGLPFAAWLDLTALSERSLTRQVHDLDQVISGIRGYYATEVVGRVLAGHEHTEVTAKFRSVTGAIPIPATFSLELGDVVGAEQHNISYRFVSDYPFRGRPAHVLDQFERDALAALRRNPKVPLTNVSWHGFDDRVRYIAPIIMEPTCVACHNTDPDSPKRDWRVGDVRGIQELSVVEPLATNVWSFSWLLTYLVFALALGVGFLVLQNRQQTVIRTMNEQLVRANAFLSSISATISRYLAPQVYKSIFLGASDGSIRTERKKLTIFFSDIKDFTPTTERLQPEELTALLNEYFTEMSAIALRFGGTIDKFIGDAIVIFFGDPETLGTAEDARACVRMACAMQERLAELQDAWHARGIEHPFQVRIGINTGYCNVGNFGSEQRMDYTIIGGEANLAARLQGIAEAGTIVMSYETYALVRDVVEADALPALRVKGINRDVVPYVVRRVASCDAARDVVDVHGTGFDLRIDPAKVTEADRERARAALRAALAQLEG